MMQLGRGMLQQQGILAVTGVTPCNSYMSCMRCQPVSALKALDSEQHNYLRVFLRL
jgi:hypothetical protein